MKKHLIATAIVASFSLSGCTGLLVGGAVVAGGTIASTLHDRRSAGTVLDDRALQVAITAKLLQDSVASACSHINVVVFNGVVLIIGEAKTDEIAKRVIQIAKSVPNIKKLESDISVGQPSTYINRGNDALLTAKIKTSLFSLSLPGFDPTLINVTTERGQVYLMGLVTKNEATAISRVASSTSGVRAVVELFEYIEPVNQYK